MVCKMVMIAIRLFNFNYVNISIEFADEYGKPP